MDVAVIVKDILEHHGIKGQKWGVRKKQDIVVSSLRSGTVVKGSEHFSKEQAASMNNVAKKMKKAYGLNIDEFTPLESKFEKKGYIAFVSARNKGSNVINMTTNPKIKKDLEELQKKGWFVPSTKGRAIESTLTHESAHALFHSANVEGKGPIGSVFAKAPIDEIRMRAWRKAEEQGRKDGDIVSKKFRPDAPQYQMTKKLSKYADDSLFVEEHEAETFTAYHWSPNPPKFVDAFMGDIHKSMGKEVQPFSGRKVTHA